MVAFAKSEKSLIESLVFGDTYGSRKNFWYSHLRKAQKNGKKVSIRIKLHYIIHQIFPCRSYMERWCQQRALCFLQHRCLMPVAYIWRIIKILAEKKEQLKVELNVVKKA